MHTQNLQLVADHARDRELGRCRREETDLNMATERAQAPNRVRRRGRMAEAVDRDMGAARQVDDGRGDVVQPGRVEQHVGAEPTGQCQRLGGNVDGDHLRPERLTDRDHCQPDTTASDDTEHLTRCETAALDHAAVGGRHPTPDECGGLVTDGLGHDHRVVVGEGHGRELGEGAPASETRLLLVTAHLMLPEPAGLALAATADERGDDAITVVDAGDAAADSDDTTDELVTTDVRADDVGVGAVPAVVVAAAQADGQDLHHRLALLRRRIRHLGDRYRPAELFVNGCSHATDGDTEMTTRTIGRIVAPGARARKDDGVSPPVSSLPTEAVTFLLTDIEGSTRAWQAAPEAMTAPVARHYAILDAAIDAHHGQRPEEQGEGDSIVAVFRTAGDAVTAALEAQRNLLHELPDLPVRMALHSGDAMLRNEHNYVGLTIIRCARIRACGHGRQILLSDDTATAARSTLPSGAGLADLGVYGLRDLAGRERVWQLTHPDLPASFPPLKAGASAAGNLPAPISSFVGRAVELATLSHAIAEHRLVVITGDAGVGKSRVAITAAAAAADSLPGGVWWVPLAGVAHDTETVMAAVAQSCAIEPGGNLFDAVSEHFRGVADALVLIDGYEPAGGGAADAVERLLGRCPTLRVLATGRQPLYIAGEVVHTLAPLATPDDTFDGGRVERGEVDAARLFVERARAAGATARFDDAEAVTIAHICRVLAGVPLAIELAAARSASVSLAQLVSSLGTLANAPAASGGTLASSIAWSFQLLSSDEQLTLQRLAVFVGSFEIDAAVVVATDGAIDDPAAAAAINGLLRQQLLGIDPGTGRVTMAPAIRQFAAARLKASTDVGATTSRHGAWFAAVAERFASDGDALPISLLNPDHADVLAAMESAMGSAEPSVAYRIIVALGDRWHPGEHTDTIEHAAAWLCGRSPSDGEQLWAAAVARIADTQSTRPDATIHAFTAEAAAIAEMVRDTVSQLVLAHASAVRSGDHTAAAAANESLRASGVARTVHGDMAATT